MSTLKTSNIQDTSGSNNSTPEEINKGRIRAWARINHDNNTVVSGYNVASMTDTSTGRFTVNFTNAFSNANYAGVALSGNNGVTTSQRSIQRDGVWTTTTAQFRNLYNNTVGGSVIDDSGISVMFIGD